MLFGLEVIIALGLVLVVGGLALGCVLHVQNRRIARFLAALQARLGNGARTLGDVGEPVSFVVEGARVSHVRRGPSDLWHLELLDDHIDAAAFSLVERGWRAPDCARMPEVDALEGGLVVQADDADGARASLASAVQHLVALVGCHAHVCMVRAGSVFIEIDRSSYDVDEVLAGLRRAHRVALLFGAKPSRLSLHAAASTHLAAPDGAPLLVPALLTHA